MTVLIAGAGIGGLATALSLHQIGVPCRVFESVDEIKPLGVGINVLPHAVRELTELGIANALAQTGIATQELAYFSKHGKEIWSEPRGRSAGYNWPQYSIHRGELQMALLRAARERLGDDAIVTGHHLDAWEETTTGVRASFSDRRSGKPLRSVEGALLIAADGIHSVARARLYPDEGLPAWDGAILWRGLTKGASFLTGRTMAMIGHERQKFVCYPISEPARARDEALINWIAEIKFAADYHWRREDWNRPGKLEEFLPAFESWRFDWLDVPGIIRACAHVYEYPMVDRDPLPLWTHGRMTLLGDAAHPMYPIGSNGASQGILDARILAREIVRHGVSETALQAYEAERRPATARIVEANRANGPDEVLELIEKRAPAGFDDLEQIAPLAEREAIAERYKRIAGFDRDTLNARPAIVPSGVRVNMP